MSSPTSSNALHSFAADFIRGRDGENLGSELLAEAVRARFELSSFPSVHELRQLCLDLGVPIWRMPDALAEIAGMNISKDDESAIFLRGGQGPSRWESTLCHEIREVLENAFQRVDPGYEGVETHNNASMNPRSDRFAGYLLMESEASRHLLRDNGFDLSEFARQTGRSLPSVVLRAQQLFSSKFAGQAPNMGVWLFEAPWSSVSDGTATIPDLRVRQIAKLAGFTQASGSLAKRVFPFQDAPASRYALVSRALNEQRAYTAVVTAMGLSESYDYLALAEPVLLRGTPWRVLVGVVRVDAATAVAGWLARLAPKQADDQPQYL